MSNVYPLHRQKHPIRHWVRIGHTGHRTLENLHAAGRAPIGRAVIDAGHSFRQKELVATLLDSGAEIILDTKAAELATLAGIHSKAGQLPWANENRPHQRSDWTGDKGIDQAKCIAEFAVANRVDTVLSPAHLIQETDSHWLVTDLQATHNLRRALDREGGKGVRIDYHLMLPISLLKELDQLLPHLKRLGGAPIDNVWLRVSGYGMGGSAAGTKRYIEAAWEIAKLNKPLVGDQVGGIAGLCLAAFGAVGGICHGVAEKEKFNTSYWRRAPSTGGSSEKRIYLPQLDEYLYRSKAETFMSGRNAKSLVVCKDRQCCLKPDDMFTHSQAHALIQSTRAIENLNAQPELKRIDYLLDRVIAETGRNLRKASKIKIADEALTKRLQKKSSRLDFLHQTLECVNRELETIPFARTPITKMKPVKKVG